LKGDKIINVEGTVNKQSDVRNVKLTSVDTYIARVQQKVCADHVITIDVKHLPHYGTKTIIPAKKKSASHVCCRLVTACFTSKCAAKPLPAKCFLRGA